MNRPSNDTEPFEVFYDSHCPMCKAEIEMIRRKDKHGRMRLTDIAEADFDPRSTGKTLDELMREIHGRYADGSLVIGVEVFREIYGRLGFDFLVRPTRWSIIRWPMDMAYRLFAGIRYRAALKRFNNNSCELPVGSFPDSQSTRSQRPASNTSMAARLESPVSN